MIHSLIKYNYPHMCYCWPHRLRVPALRSAPPPPQYGAPPVKPLSGTVPQSRTRTGTAKAGWWAAWLAGEHITVHSVCSKYGVFSLPFHIAYPQRRFWQCLTASLLSRSLELPRQLEENTEHLHFTPSRSHTQPVLMIASCPYQSKAVGLGILALPDIACTATRRKPFTSPFSLTMATRWTRGTGYSRLLR